MSERINQFCDKLRVRLTDVDDRITSLKGGLETAAAKAKTDVKSQLDEAKATLESRKDEAAQAQARIQTMLEEKTAQTEATIEEWVRDRNVDRMEARAQLAENLASEQVWLAMVAVEEAEAATLGALAARIEADELAAG